MVLYSLDLPPQLHALIKSVVVSDEGSIAIEWQKPVVVHDLVADGRGCFTAPFAVASTAMLEARFVEEEDRG